MRRALRHLWAVLLVVVGCSRAPTVEDRVIEIERSLARIDRPYGVRGDMVIESDDTRLKELVDRYRDDVDVLEQVFGRGSGTARLFAFHALSRSGIAGFEATYGRWVERVVEDGDVEAQSVALWYSFSFNERVIVRVEAVLKLLGNGRRVRQTLLAVRNGALVIDDEPLPDAARWLFEGVMPHLRNAADDSARFAQEILQTMTTVGGARAMPHPNRSCRGESGAAKCGTHQNVGGVRQRRTPAGSKVPA